MERRIRFARPADAEALRAIYRQYIHTGITFEYRLPSAEEFRRRIRQIGRDYPYLVLEEAGRVAGYAYGHRYREREAYQWTAELSIYLDQEAQGKGLGRALYGQLIRLLALQGVKTLYALVTSSNPASLVFHEKLGFEPLGVHKRAGYKGGRWLDMHWYQLRLGDMTACPALFIPFRRLPLRQIRRAMVPLARAGYNTAKQTEGEQDDQV